MDKLTAFIIGFVALLGLAFWGVMFYVGYRILTHFGIL